MMMESIGLEQASGNDWRRSAWLVVVAVVLLLIAAALAWLGAQRTEHDARQVAVLSELQLVARDVGALSSLAASGNQAALAQLRDRVATLESMLAVLIAGGTHKGEVVAPVAGASHARLQEFATHWADFKRRTDTLAVMTPASEPQSSKDGAQRRSAEKRSAAPSASKTVAGRGTRDVELNASAFSLLNTGRGLAGTLDGIRAEVDGQARTPWPHYLAMACVLGALAALSAFAVSVWRSGQALEQTIERANIRLMDALRPAMNTLHIAASASGPSDPATLGRRLSEEVIAVVDGVKTLVKALDAATAEADKFAVVGHVAARALADAEQKAADTSKSLQATARRIAAVYSTLSANAGDTQQQCAQIAKVVETALASIRDSIRSCETLKEHLDSLIRQHAQAVAVKNELAQSLFEVADTLTQAEGFALRASDRPASSGTGQMDAFVTDVRGYLTSSLSMLKKAMEVAQRGEREADACAQEVARVGAIAADHARVVANSAYVLANTDETVKALSAKLSSTMRLASATEGSQLLAALDESVRQIAHSSASAREVLNATQNAASRIENLAKLLNTMKPS